MFILGSGDMIYGSMKQFSIIDFVTKAKNMALLKLLKGYLMKSWDGTCTNCIFKL